MSTYVPQSDRTTEMPELEYQLLRAWCAMAAPRSAQELADAIGRNPVHVEAVMTRFAERGLARCDTAWTLTRTGHAALGDHAVRQRLTAPQATLLRTLDRADGARAVVELASHPGARAAVTETMQALHAAVLVRPVPVWEATGRAHRVLSSIRTTDTRDDSKHAAPQQGTSRRKRGSGPVFDRGRRR